MMLKRLLGGCFQAQGPQPEVGGSAGPGGLPNPPAGAEAARDVDGLLCRDLWRTIAARLAPVDLLALGRASPAVFRWLRSAAPSEGCAFLADYPPLAHRQGVVGRASDLRELIVQGSLQGEMRALACGDATRRAPAFAVVAVRARVTHLWLDESHGRMAVACADGSAHLWQLSPRVRKLSRPLRLADPVVHIACDAGGGRALLCDARGAVHLWEATRRPRLSLALGRPEGGPAFAFDHATFSSSAEHALLGDARGYFEIWSVKEGARCERLHSLHIDLQLGAELPWMSGRLCGTGAQLTALIHHQPGAQSAHTAGGGVGALWTPAGGARLERVSGWQLLSLDRTVGRLARYGDRSPEYASRLGLHPASGDLALEIVAEGVSPDDVPALHLMRGPAEMSTLSVGGTWVAAADVHHKLRVWRLRPSGR